MKTSNLTLAITGEILIFNCTHILRYVLSPLSDARNKSLSLLKLSTKLSILAGVLTFSPFTFLCFLSVAT